MVYCCYGLLLLGSIAARVCRCRTPVTSAERAANSSLLDQCTGSGIWMEMQGSDHAPCWADWNLIQPLPTPEIAPALSTRYMFTGKDQDAYPALLCLRRPNEQHRHRNKCSAKSRCVSHTAPLVSQWSAKLEAWCHVQTFMQAWLSCCSSTDM